MSEQIKMTVEMEVTPAQGLALQAMFERWNYLSRIGSSKVISFFVGGGLDFDPQCKVKFNKKIRTLSNRFKNAALMSESAACDYSYDYDHIAYILNNETPEDRLRSILG